MSQPATDGGLLDELVTLSIPICRRADAECPRRGPGRKPTIPEWVLAAMILVAVLLRETRERQRHRRLRDGRTRFFHSRRGRALYARRKTSVEPFHARLKHLFELEHRVWHRGPDNNRTMILAAIHGHQVLLTYNHRNQKPVAHRQQLLDALEFPDSLTPSRGHATRPGGFL